MSLCSYDYHNNKANNKDFKNKSFSLDFKLIKYSNYYIKSFESLNLDSEAFILLIYTYFARVIPITG